MSPPKLRVAAIWLCCLAAIAGCNFFDIGFSFRTFGAATVGDLDGRQVAQGRGTVRSSTPIFSSSCHLAPTQASAQGGSATACLAADTQSIEDLQAMIAALEGARYPSPIYSARSPAPSGPSMQVACPTWIHLQIDVATPSGNGCRRLERVGGPRAERQVEDQRSTTTSTATCADDRAGIGCLHVRKDVSTLGLGQSVRWPHPVCSFDASRSSANPPSRTGSLSSITRPSTTLREDAAQQQEHEPKAAGSSGREHVPQHGPELGQGQRPPCSDRDTARGARLTLPEAGRTIPARAPACRGAFS